MTETLLDPPVAEEPDEPKRNFPFELSALIKNVIGNAPITAINAGDGSLLAAFDPAYRFGLDPNENNRAADGCTYQKVYGDLVKVGRMLSAIGVGAEHLIIDLSRDEDWNTPLNLAAQLHEDAGYDVRLRFVMTAYVTKREDADRLLEREGIGNPIARISVTDIEEPLVVTFTTTGRDLPALEGTVPQRGATLELLDLLNAWVLEQATARHTYFRPHRVSTYTGDGRRNAFEATHREYGRRYIAKGGAENYDVELVGKRQINVTTTPYVNRVLEHLGKGHVTNQIQNKMVDHFAQNPGHWVSVRELIEEEVLNVEPRLIELAEAVVRESLRVTIPLTRVSPAQRLAWLTSRTRIQCIKDLPEGDFKAGEWYSLRTIEDDDWDYWNTQRVDKKTGELLDVKLRDKIRFTWIRIANRSWRDDIADDVNTVLEHFAVPDPGDVYTDYPETVEPMLDLLDDIEREYVTPGLAELLNDPNAGYKTFQKGDLARLLAKDDGILAWEQGLGKTLGELTFIEAGFRKGAQKCALIICPKDLIPQTIREAKKFFNWDLEQIGGKLEDRHRESQKHLPRNKRTKLTKQQLAQNELARVHAIAKRLRDPNEEGIFITSFYDLAQLGKLLTEKDAPFTVGSYEEQTWVPTDYVEDPTAPGGYRRIEGHYKTETVELRSDAYCPACVKRLGQNGKLGKDDITGLTWNGTFCRRRVQHPSDNPHRTKSRIRERYARGFVCGHSAFSKKAPTIANLLSTAFRRGVVVVDEGTEISGESQQSEAVRGLSGKYRLVLTGTPIRNFVGQSFYLLWWALRGSPENKRFPYSMHNKAEYERLFSVQRQKLKDGKWVADGTKAGRITNNSRFWRMGASSIIRTRKEDSGEPIVKKKTHVLRAPLGLYQREQHEFYRENFPDLWAEKNPDDPRIKTGAHKRISHLLGLDQKWNWVAIAPECDADSSWSGIPVSNWTPMAFKTLETTLRLVKLGRKVVVGCDLQLGADFLRKALESKGVKVACTLDASGSTKAPDKRADDITYFQEGDAQVLVATIKSIRLGHNLDQGNAVVFHGLDWQYESFSQFEARPHRLTSKRPIDVFVVLPGEADQTIPGRKWASLEDKTKGVQTAIDGEVSERDEETIDKKAIFKEMLEKGIPKTGNEVPETRIKTAFEQMPHVTNLEVPQSFIDTLAKEDEFEEILPTPKTYITPRLTHGMVADALEAFFLGASQLESRWLEIRAATALFEFVLALYAQENRKRIEAVIQYDEPIGPEWPPPEDLDETLRHLTLVANELEEEIEEEIEGHTVEPDIDEDQTTHRQTDDPEYREEERQEQERQITPVVTVNTAELVASLKELGELKTIGVLTEEEFAEMKAAIIQQMKQGAGVAA